MNAYPRNHFEWPEMSDVDDYIAAVGKCESFVARISALRGELDKFTAALTTTPLQASHALPMNWYHRGEWLELLNEGSDLFNDAQARWTRLTADQKRMVAGPPHNLVAGRHR